MASNHARSVKFLHLYPLGPADPTALQPTPAWRDWEHIAEGLKGAPTIIHVDTLLEGTHDIRGSYRGWNIHLYPNVCFYRAEPQTSGGQGMAGCPTIGLNEDVVVYMDGEKYAAQIEFV